VAADTSLIDDDGIIPYRWAGLVGAKNAAAQLSLISPDDVVAYRWVGMLVAVNPAAGLSPIALDDVIAYRWAGSIAVNSATLLSRIPPDHVVAYGGAGISAKNCSTLTILPSSSSPSISQQTVAYMRIAVGTQKPYSVPAAIAVFGSEANRICLRSHRPKCRQTVHNELVVPLEDHFHPFVNVQG